MHKVFISYHHEYDQAFKDELLRINGWGDDQIFIDGSVDTGDISDLLSDEAIREKIRDEYLRDASVTIVLVGLQTKYRKRVDWEIYSSMHDGKVNKKSGILAMVLPSADNNYFIAAHANEKQVVYPDCSVWTNFDSRTEYEKRHPYLPDRIIDSLCSGARISIVPWQRIAGDRRILQFLVDVAYDDRESCSYDMSRPLRRRNN